MMQRHMIVLVAASSFAACSAPSIRRHSAAHRDFGKHGSGTIRMPGQMMTKRGKKNQMQRDFANCNRRKGKLRQ
jgi:hypothetical protein